MKRKKIVGLVLCIILLIYFIGGIIYNFVLKEDKPSVKKEVNSLTIKGYDYLLYDNDLEIYKKQVNAEGKIPYWAYIDFNNTDINPYYSLPQLS